MEPDPEPYSEPCQAPKMEPFVKIVNRFKKMFGRVLNTPLISDNLL